MKAKKKWQKLVSMALCLVMLLSMLPTQALAAMTVTAVTLTNVKEPVVGEHPSTTFTVSPSGIVNATGRWVYFDSNGLGHNMSSTDVFKSGTKYAFYVTATTKSGYVFPYTTEVDDYDDEYEVYSGNLTINGQMVTGYVDNDGIGMTFNWWFKPALSNTCKVTFVVEGNCSTPAAQNVTRGSCAKKPTVSVGSGYVFDGWYTDKNYICDYDFSEPVTEDITLYGRAAKPLSIAKICGAEIPVAGKYVADSMNLYSADGSFEFNDIKWCVTGSEYSDNWLEDEQTFIAGKQYYLKCTIYGINGYIIDDEIPVVFDCDGISMCDCTVGENSLEFWTNPVTARAAGQCAAPVLSSVTNVPSGIAVKWGAVDGAAKYRVFRKVSGGSWAKLTDTSSTSYTDTTAKAGTTYYYTVRCLDSAGKYCSSYDTKGKACRRLVNQTITSLTNASGGMVVKWPKSTGAAGYYVYRKTGTGSFGKIATITSGSTVSYTDAAVKDNNATTYTYAVRAYYGSSSSSYTGKSYVRLTTPAISTLTNVTGSKMKVTWGKKSSVSGYQIQYSTKSDFSSGNKSVTVSGASTVTKTISSLTKGKTYYVRIRTYKTVSGTNYYSGWSGKKSVKISK